MKLNYPLPARQARSESTKTFGQSESCVCNADTHTIHKCNKYKEPHVKNELINFYTRTYRHENPDGQNQVLPYIMGIKSIANADSYSCSRKHVTPEYSCLCLCGSHHHIVHSPAARLSQDKHAFVRLALSTSDRRSI